MPRLAFAFAVLSFAPCSLAQCEPEWLGTIGDGVQGTVLAIYDDDGAIAVGGKLTLAGTTPIKNIARWDGQAWDTLDGGANSTVYAISRFQGDLIITGDFTSVGTVNPIAANRVAAWDGVQWHPLGTGLSSSSGQSIGLACRVYQGHLFVGGQFTDAGGSGAVGLAAWDGAVWSTLSPAMPSNIVFGFGEHDNALLIGGVNGVDPFPTSGVIKWDGVTPTSFADPALLSWGGVWGQQLDGCLDSTIMRAFKNEPNFGFNVAYERSNGQWQQVVVAGEKPNNLPNAKSGVGLAAYLHGRPIIAINGNDSSFTWLTRRDGDSWKLLTPQAAAGKSRAFAHVGHDLLLGGNFQSINGLNTPGLVRLGCACYADCDNSKSADIDDFICFQTRFALADPYADCDADGDLTIDDFVCFQAAYALGC